MIQLIENYIIIYDTWIIHETDNLSIATAKLKDDNKYILSAYTKVGNIYLPVDINK